MPLVLHLRRRSLTATLTVFLSGVGLVPAAGQEDEEKFERQSLALRTALHHEPSLERPVEQLVDLYREDGREDELVGLYQAHLAGYPGDAGARVVYLRVLRSLGRSRLLSAANHAATLHPESALIAYLLFEELDRQRSPEAEGALLRAIELEADAARRWEWIAEFVDRSPRAGEAIETLFLTEIGRSPGDARRLLAIAQKLLEIPAPVDEGKASPLAALALEAVGQAHQLPLSPEEDVEASMVAARAEAARGEAVAATRRIDALLDKVADDYWRRPEIVALRVDLLGSDAAREAMLADARERFVARPESEVALLQLVELLEASGMRRDALEVLLDAGGAHGRSPAVEKRILALCDRLGDMRRAAAYLGKRVEEEPGRSDLALRYARSLFVTARGEEARSVFAEASERLSSDRERAEKALEMARFLRRSGIPREAVRYFEHVLDRHPDRVDVLRELAETLLAEGDRRAAAEALELAAVASGEAAVENVLDVVQFMVGQGFLLEAKETLARRIETDPNQFDLHLLQVETFGKLADQHAGESAVVATRQLADTGARYARWLEAAVAFHEVFGSQESFFDAEQVTFSGDISGWDIADFGRFVTFCEVSRRGGREDELAEVLREKLGGGVSGGESLRDVRRILVDVLEGDPDNFGEVYGHLETLVDEDSANASTYRVRMAKIQFGRKRTDLARSLVEETDVSALNDPSVLAGVPGMCIELGLVDRAHEALEMLTALEPSTLGHWEQRAALLVATGEEKKLRDALRTLLEGGSGASLSEGTFTLLRKHLAASYWRSVARTMDRANAGNEALALLARAEELAADANVRGWVLWARAEVFLEMGRVASATEAANELQQFIGGRQGKTETEKIDFPDGLSLDARTAVSHLLDRSGRGGEATPDPDGPEGQVAVEWAFDPDEGKEIIQVLVTTGSGEGEAMLVLDDSATLFKLEGESGKVLWRLSLDEAGEAPPFFSGSGGRSRTVVRRHVLPSLRLAPRLVAGEGRFFQTVGGKVICRSTDDGNVLWEASLGEVLPQAPPPSRNSMPPPTAPPRMFLDGGRLTVYSPATATVASFLAPNGKLIWTRDLFQEENPSPPAALAAGAAYDDGRLFVFGRQPAIYDAATGREMWTFSAGAVERFPPSLRTEDEGDSPVSSIWGQAALVPALPAANLNYMKPDLGGGRGVRDFLLSRGRAVAPAVDWAERYAGKGLCFAAVSGTHLLLMGGTDSVQVFPLGLPIGARQFAVSGVFVGVSAQKAVFLRKGGHALAVVDLVSGGNRVIDVFPSDGKSGGDVIEDVAISNGRVFVTGGGEVVCLNLHTGGTLFRNAVPELAQTVDEEGAVNRGQESRNYYWQGVAAGATGWGSLCRPLRGAVASGRYYAVSGGRLYAFGHREPNENPGIEQ